MFIFGIVLLIAGVVVIVGAAVLRQGKGVAWGVAVLVVGMLVWTGASYNKVPTRNVGIVTQFSKPTGETTGAGLHWTKPWQDIDDWDASGQTFDRLGDNCLWVSIAAQRRMCVAVQVEWSSKPETAPEMWAQYKPTDQGKKINGDNARFGTYTYRRVNPQIDGAITSVFASFDPLGAVKDTGDAPAPDLNKSYRQPLLDAINGVLGQDVNVRTIAFATPQYDKPTTDAIAAYGQKVLEARNLAVDKTNAAARADIARSTGVSPFEQQCLAAGRGEPGLCRDGASITPVKPIG